MQNAIKQNDFTFDGWKYNTMPVIKNAGDQNTEDNKGYYIDLPIEMPFTSDEIFDSTDLEFAEEFGLQQKFAKPFQSTNILWNVTSSSGRPAGTIGYIRTKKYQNMLRDYFHETFSIDMLDKKVEGFFPVTLIKFQWNSHYHREGYAEHHTAEQREYLKLNRSQYAINFKLWGDDKGTAVEFGEQSNDIDALEQTLLNKLMVKHPDPQSGSERVAVTDDTGDTFGVYTGRDGFLGEGNEYEEREVTPVVRRVGYTNPYIINLQKYHRIVLSEEKSRISMRLMCSDKDFTFEQIEELNEKGLLLK
tara:strand:+ start:1566 stop:2477 length:912 start_codon:yes stop_codon:yes gene_type:complete